MATSKGWPFFVWGRLLNLGINKEVPSPDKIANTMTHLANRAHLFNSH